MVFVGMIDRADFVTHMAVVYARAMNIVETNRFSEI